MRNLRCTNHRKQNIHFKVALALESLQGPMKQYVEQGRNKYQNTFLNHILVIALNIHLAGIHFDMRIASCSKAVKILLHHSFLRPTAWNPLWLVDGWVVERALVVVVVTWHGKRTTQPCEMTRMRTKALSATHHTVTALP
eukprot:4341741-Amphidinium_carterae.1